ncbi:MAG: TonB family protein [Candidatus Acidiferrales bacterium]
MNAKIAVAVSSLAVLLCSSGALYAQDSPSAPPPPPDKPEAAPAAPAPSTRPMRIRIGGNVQKPKLTHMVEPIYPQIARTAHVEGTIEFHAVIAKDGTVEELKYVSGPMLLMRAAMLAVQQWRYAPTLLNGEPVEVDTTISVPFSLSGVAKAQDENQGQKEADSKPAGGGEDSQEPAPSIPSEEPIASTPDKPEAPPPSGLSTRIRVGGKVQMAKIIYQVQPKYPKEAKKKRISGTVVLRAVIAKNGTIQELQFVSGPPELMRSAMDAVRKWRYEPTTLEGRPVEVVTTVSVVYTLSG